MSLPAGLETPEKYRVAEKVYLHRHSYAKCHLNVWIEDANGVRTNTGVKTITFANGRYITDDRREQEQLDPLVNAHGTMIYNDPNADSIRSERAVENEVLSQALTKAAIASDIVNNRPVDANAQIVPVTIQAGHLQSNVGAVNSLSGVAAAAPITTLNVGGSVPATDAAAAALASLKSTAGQS